MYELPNKTQRDNDRNAAVLGHVLIAKRMQDYEAGEENAESRRAITGSREPHPESLYQSMNHHLINAVLQLECAIEATFEPVERKELEEIAVKLRRKLQGRGIFLGVNDTMLNQITESNV